MINEILAKFIYMIHIIIILLVIIIPFVPSPYFLMLYAIFIPFLWLHWVSNNDTCVLTTLEKYLRNAKTEEDKKDCITCRLIDPMFGFKKNYEDLSTYIYVITIALWLLSISRLAFKVKTGEIKMWRDLFKL